MRDDMLQAVVGHEPLPIAPPQPFLANGQSQWFALYTWANHEKCVAAHLAACGIEHFLPLYRSLRRWKDRRVLLDLPLFPGYLFVRFARYARAGVLEAPGVVRLVGFDGQPYPLPEQEIESLRAGMNSALRFEPHRYLTVGARVRLVRGPLAGLNGILLRRKNSYRVVLSLDLIARSAAVEVDATDLERI